MHGIKVRTGPGREKAGFSPGTARYDYISLDRFLKLFELLFPHLNNEAYEMQLSEPLGGIESNLGVINGTLIIVGF